MAIVLRQSASNSHSSCDGRTFKICFDRPTLAGSALILVASVRGDMEVDLDGGGSWTQVIWNNEGHHLSLLQYYQLNAPSVDEIEVRINNSRAFQARCFEYEGIRATAAQDKRTGNHGDDDDFDSLSTGTTTQAEELVIGAVANRNASTRQYGFRGGFTKLAEHTTPSDDSDYYRVRTTYHHRIVSATGSFRLYGDLSCCRDWCAHLVTYKGGATGPIELAATPTVGDAGITITGGSAGLSVFGELQASTTSDETTVAIDGSATMYPFDHQYLIDGRLLVGAGTNYRVESIEGLEGWQLRTSDDDQPFSDGSIRGNDLQSAREIIFTLGTLPGGGTTSEVEEALEELYRALVPRRAEDWELVWRHPGRAVRMLRCRPIDLIRGLDQRRVLFQDQKFVLRAADPRHYSPVPIIEDIPVSSGDDPTYVTVSNDGSAPAYPLIRVQGPSSGPVVTRVELVNESADVAFDVLTALPSGSELVGDMEARITAAGRSVVTVNGVSKYGAWQFPREAFRLDPDPDVDNGSNALYLRTVPDGAPVTCTIEYRHTWWG